MLKYGKILNNETGLCSIGIGSDIDYYKSIGMTELDVEQSDIDNQWYLTEKCPHKSEEEKEKEEQERINNDPEYVSANRDCQDVLDRIKNTTIKDDE